MPLRASPACFPVLVRENLHASRNNHSSSSHMKDFGFTLHYTTFLPILFWKLALIKVVVTPGCCSLQVTLYRFVHLLFLWRQHIHCRFNFILRPWDKKELSIWGVAKGCSKSNFSDSRAKQHEKNLGMLHSGFNSFFGCPDESYEIYWFNLTSD